MYHSLLRFHKGKIKNRGNLKQAARQCNIPNLLSMSMQEITHRLEACKKECIFYQEHGKRFQRKHLKTRKRVAQEEEEGEAFNKICTIIQHEQQRNFWGKLNYVTGKNRTRSATSIQVEAQGGAILERTMQGTVEQTIFTKIHEKRYTLAGKAPICNGELFNQFGYMANMLALKAVLDGNYKAPANLDTATNEIFTEIAAICRLVPANSVSIVISPEQWKQYWKVVNEETSSTKSGIHFGHYIVGSKSNIISHYHAALVSITLAHTIQLERWSRGLSVMLEKTLGITLVNKLHVILIMEGDFNAANKMVYGVRMLNNARDHNLMPEEIFSKRNRMANDGMLRKTLFYNITRQACVPAAIALVDVSNCYDRIAHAMAYLIFQVFGVPTTAIKSMLGTIENMNFL